MTNAISVTINNFVNSAIEQELINPIDRHYITNRLMALVNIDELTNEVSNETHLLTLMDNLTQYAVENNVIENIGYAKEQFEAAVMDLITPSPSQLNETFWKLYQEHPEKATNYFYHLSQTNDYIKTRNIAKNIQFSASYKQYGDLDITINLSKPEKDPKEIALAKTAKQSNYPLCLLCMENEGYKGRSNHPARQQHRLVRLDLDGRHYGMQYSPYVYYNEHSIFLSELHTPMKIDRKAIDNLLAIVERLPHYFAGSNADLPIVGGSILAHDHYQGGRYTFPMERATVFDTVKLSQYPTVSAQLVKWPMTVIRLTADKRQDVADAGEAILNFWREYSDESVDVIAYTDDTPHNTVTPVARRRSNAFELDIVLRNNRTTEEHPDGLFHPHQDVQHIKKENIGLIEVMGLAILPPRLVAELEAVKQYLLGATPLSTVATMHQEWAQELQSRHTEINENNIQALIEQAVADKFGRVLEDAGVFKQDEQGIAALMRFITAFNQQ
ncbi:UDP-glucose--hexose-1-phosphate uridylyltransferase [Aerococcaceae bacterium zg-ZJ1578]|uniref:UDP-glucose--hexose-1-phosphate uridylyltransferase n=1 Tax=Aerococcaceae bacterium zg-252 TaxID=2796928 RepID=UPI001A325EB3|nr:UDP-glucose--hexose-1-phosphate uridylyltransferase [Aerococcaceae bacterium zg-1578]